MTICLSAKELLCAAALLGVPEVIAVPDVFRDMAPDRLREEIRDAQQSLEQKGLLELDFDGNCTLVPACLPLLETVLKGRRVIVIDTQLHSRGQAGCVCYRSGRRVVRSVPKGGMFELSEVPAEQAVEELCGGITWVRGKRLSCEPFLISQKQLHQSKASDPLNALRKLGADNELSAVMADAFSFKTNYYSFTFLDRMPGGRLMSLIFIDDIRGMLKLAPVVEKDQNYILIQPAQQEQLKAELTEAVRDMLQSGEEG